MRQEEELGRLVNPLDLPGVLCAVNRPLYITSALQHMIVHDIKYQVFLTAAPTSPSSEMLGRDGSRRLYPTLADSTPLSSRLYPTTPYPLLF